MKLVISILCIHTNTCATYKQVQKSFKQKKVLTYSNTERFTHFLAPTYSAEEKNVNLFLLFFEDTKFS